MIEIPESVDEKKLTFWIAEGMGRELFRKLAMDALKSGMSLDLEKALREFDTTRSEVWSELKMRYGEEGLIE
ncbi:hypothetical protein GACE_1155 [Geoglobus acetivorans]|uniref:Uncharacterized protein n=2 Tax=Geoglobus acetivorans TaxID=565033 RepID=A0A0A7GGW9_GEOAI|nr:hypothetical protein GACE_1155 [Geoglobus acetivorans]